MTGKLWLTLCCTSILTASMLTAHAAQPNQALPPPPGAQSPTAAELNMMAQEQFKRQGSGEQQSWDLAFENGYADGFKKTHHR